MIVIANKTETRLREDLKRFVKVRPSQRCFYLALSKTDIPKDKLFETFLRLLEEIPNSYMAQVYLCADKDILIMMEGFMQRQFQDFVKKLIAELEVKDFSDLINIFELGEHWNTLEELYTKKIEAVQFEEKLKTDTIRKVETEKTTLEALSKLDAKAVETIKNRRASRQEPLVMIADDDQLPRTLAGNVLGAEYDIVFADGGESALQKFVSNAPDVLFLDIGMPDIDGHDVLETLFQIDPDAYIIMFSGRKDKSTVMKSLKIGAQGFLGKPFTREQLYNHVQNSPHIRNKKSVAA